MQVETTIEDTAITANNWLSPPLNRRSFQMMSDLFQTVKLSRGDGAPSELPSKLRDDLTSWQYHSSIYAEPRSINEMLKNSDTDAFVVMRHGAILTEVYENGMRPDTPHLINSITKTWVGMLAGILVAEGAIDPAQSIVHYLPEFKATGFAGTTLQQALDMTGAVAYSEDHDIVSDDFWHETATIGWRPEHVTSDSARSLFEFARGLTKTEQINGEKFHYRTVYTNVIAMVIEKATGNTVQALLEDKIWRKLGPQEDASIVKDPTGFPYVGAGMSACARDLARFGEMLRCNGFYNGVQVVPAEWVQQTLRGNDELKKLCKDAISGNTIMSLFHYHNQTWANSEENVLMCNGIYGQFIYVNQTTGVVIVKLSSQPTASNGKPLADALYACHGLSTMLANEQLEGQKIKERKTSP